MLKGMSIPVIPDPCHSPFKPDVIHGQHHLDTMRALCAFPDSPAIYHCHGYLPWVEEAPLYPRILYCVGMCSIVSDRTRRWPVSDRGDGFRIAVLPISPQVPDKRWVTGKHGREASPQFWIAHAFLTAYNCCPRRGKSGLKRHARFDMHHSGCSSAW